MWRSILAFLASLASDPVEARHEVPRACAAVSIARASMEREKRREGQEEITTPPLVPIEQPLGEGDVECKGGDCWYVERKTGRRWRIVR